MPTIITLHDPLGVNRREVSNVPDGTLLLGWLIERFGPDGFDIPTNVYKNRLDPSCEIVLSEHTRTGYPLQADDVIIICRTPQGLDPVTLGVIVFIGTLLLVSLLPKPKIPEFQQAQQSPNNSLTGQTNIARPLQRIPDIYGKNLIFPDLIANTYFEFINHQKHLTEYLCIGRGSFLVDDIKSGDTLISDIPNSTATVYEPFTRPTDLFSAIRSNSVDGQEVFAEGSLKLPTFTSAVRFTASDTLQGDDSQYSDFQNLEDGDSLTIAGASAFIFVPGSSDISFSGSVITGPFGAGSPFFAVGQIVNVTGTTSNDGQYEVAVSTLTTIDCIDPVTGAAVAFTTESNTSALVSTVFDNDGTYTFKSVFLIVDLVNSPPNPTVYEVEVYETTFASVAVDVSTTFSSTAEKPNYIGFFQVPGSPDHVWFNFEFPRGLTNSGAATTVQLDMILQEVDGTGTPVAAEEHNYVDITDNTLDPRAYTFKLVPGTTGRRYQAKVVNLLPSPTDTDQVKWVDLTGMEDVVATDFGGITTVQIVTRATELATQAQARKFNAVVTRKLVTYSGGGVTSVEAATARMADAMLNILTDPSMGNKPAAQIDLDELYAIQDALDADAIYDDKLGRFCYTFSDQNSPVGDEVLACANSCRVFVTRGGDMVNFSRDEKQDTRVTLFNQRNKRPDSETKTISMQKPNDPDGVSLEWSDETTGEAGTITIPEGSAPANPSTIKAAGIRNYYQAWNRARFEYLRLVYLRQRVSTQVTMDGLLVSLGDRVANVDGTLIKSQGGEVVGVNDLAITTSERLDFEGSATGSMILRDSDGSVSVPVQVTQGSQANEVVLASLPFALTVRGDSDYQIGTLYTFNPNSDHTAQDYMINSIKPGSDGYVTVGMTNYTDEIYAPDTETPTPQV